MCLKNHICSNKPFLFLRKLKQDHKAKSISVWIILPRYTYKLICHEMNGITKIPRGRFSLEVSPVDVHRVSKDIQT